MTMQNGNTMVNNVKTEKKASIFFSSMEQEIYLKAYLQFFDSILTASKPSRTPVALNFLIISESRLSGEYQGKQTFQNRICSLNLICKVIGYMIPSMAVNELMFPSKRLKQTEIILRGKVAAPCVRWHNKGYKSQRQFASCDTVRFCENLSSCARVFSKW